MNIKPVRILIIPANVDSPVYTALSHGYRDLNLHAQCEIGTIVDATERLRLYAQPNQQLSMWVDDEGLLNEKPFNVRASHMSGTSLVGDAVLMCVDIDTGESVDLLKGFCEMMIDNPSGVEYSDLIS